MVLPFQAEAISFEPHLICRLLMLSIWTCIKFCRMLKIFKDSEISLSVIVAESGCESVNMLPNTTVIKSLIHHFETVPYSKKLQTTTEMWLLNYFKIQIAWKTLWKKGEIAHFEQFHLLPIMFS